VSPRAVCSRRRRTVALSSTSRGFEHNHRDTNAETHHATTHTNLERKPVLWFSLTHLWSSGHTHDTSTHTDRSSFALEPFRLAAHPPATHSGHAIVCASHGRIPCGVPRWLFAEPLDPPCPERSYILSAPPSLQVCDAPLRPAGLAAGLDSTPTRSHDVQDTRDRAMTMPSQRADRSDRHGSMCRHHTPVAPRLCPQPP